MMKALTVLVVSISVLVLGLYIPSILLLDQLFSAGYVAIDALGLWRSGPSWVIEHRVLAVFCFILTPILISLLLSFTIVTVFERLRRRSMFLAVLFVLVTAAGLILIQYPPAGRISFFGYWSANY